MLRITVPGGEFYNEDTNEFITVKPVELQMEHSLISVSKWEARWKKAYNTELEKTPEEILDYFRCMTINRVNPEVYDRLSDQNIKDIFDYINDSMTAVYFNTFGQEGKKRSGDTMTSEVIYYYMIALGIPFECEKWHLNKLMALLEVCSIKNRPAKSMSRSEINRRNQALNAARKRKYHTSG